MSTASKKISSLLFILLGFAPLLFVLFFAIKQQSIRRRMKERMEEQMLHTITLNDADIHWKEEGKEIWVDGKMFDIESIEHKNGVTIFRGLFDEEETALTKKFNEGLKKNSKPQSRLLMQLFQCLRGICLNPDSNISLLSDNRQDLAFLSPGKLPNFFQTILTPPPQVDYSF